MKIFDLPHLEECVETSQYRGGYVDADAYTSAGPGYAIAGATAFAEGLNAFVTTRTITSVRVNRHVTISRALAFSRAVAVTENGIERDRDFSRSIYISHN